MIDTAIVLLPGLGADERLFEAQRAAIKEVVFIEWPEHIVGESVGDFASRMVERIPKAKRLFIGGVSFGGMVAFELAKRLNPAAVILVGSCRSSSAIHPVFRAIKGLVSMLPEFFFVIRRWQLPFIIPMFGNLDRENKEIFFSMAQRTSAAFIKWGLAAILDWKPSAVSCDVYHIHGSKDRLIAVRKVEPNRVISGGGHLLTLTHPLEVNKFLLEIIR